MYKNISSTSVILDVLLFLLYFLPEKTLIDLISQKNIYVYTLSIITPQHHFLIQKADQYALYTSGHSSSDYKWSSIYSQMTVYYQLLTSGCINIFLLLPFNVQEKVMDLYNRPDIMNMPAILKMTLSMYNRLR